MDFFTGVYRKDWLFVEGGREGGGANQAGSRGLSGIVRGLETDLIRSLSSAALSTRRPLNLVSMQSKCAANLAGGMHTRPPMHAACM